MLPPGCLLIDRHADQRLGASLCVRSCTLHGRLALLLWGCHGGQLELVLEQVRDGRMQHRPSFWVAVPTLACTRPSRRSSPENSPCGVAGELTPLFSTVHACDEDEVGVQRLPRSCALLHGGQAAQHRGARLAHAQPMQVHL